ncbi:MAG: DUF6036 family nucleotidyltransferase [Deltaproteobacteria bacterium]|nr:DUF6036 family nucleotidyltransferase [Deltaproteobacteria bacterium]
MKKEEMLKALAELDRKLQKPATVLVGGGAAMLLCHQITLQTADIDALILSSEITPADLDPLVKAVARELGLSPHWYNDYFSTFTYSLPKDFRTRLKPVFQGAHLTALALGKEDLLVMKCFAGREKDVGHARVLIRKGTDIEKVESHIRELEKKGVPRAEEAITFLNDLLDEDG